VRAHAAPTQRFLLPYVVTGDARGVFSLCFLMMRECLLTTHGAGWLHVSTSTSVHGTGLSENLIILPSSSSRKYHRFMNAAVECGLS
jgi:hypothetical protein